MIQDILIIANIMQSIVHWTQEFNSQMNKAFMTFLFQNVSKLKFCESLLHGLVGCSWIGVLLIEWLQSFNVSCALGFLSSYFPFMVQYVSYNKY